MSRADWVYSAVAAFLCCAIVIAVVVSHREAQYRAACVARGGVPVAAAHSQHRAVCLRAVDTIQVQR